MLFYKLYLPVLFENEPSFSSGFKELKRQADATPHAASLIEGMRDFGYTLETAMADVIDNSVTAGASLVEILAETSTDEPWLAIRDDGHGMNAKELIEAMRPGSKDPRDRREGHDLGRFGLGLKTASFSQCRRLTVITRKKGLTTAATWDLDHVSKNGWNIEIDDTPAGLPAIDHMNNEDGTVVLWQKLDRLSTNFQKDNEKRSVEINKAISSAERHLRLCFHRYMEGTSAKFSILLNGRRLKPIDPFATEFTATQPDPEERLPLKHGDVVTQCFTLPHHSRVSKSVWDELGGPEGHLRTQGFYVYRERRLIIAGGWLGLARQRELTKLARVRVDIPNTMDSDWKIDVRKASAQLPPVVRERLRKIVERLQGTSKRTYQKRGRKLVSEENLPLWNRIQKEGNIVYRPNIEHPSITGFARALPEEYRFGFSACMNLLGTGLPIAALHADMLGSAESVASDRADFDELADAAETAVRALFQTGMTGDEVARTLCSTEPFLHHKKAVRKLINEIASDQEE